MKTSLHSSALEKALSYKFKNQALLELSLTHRSFSNEKGLLTNNERLEFLGDSVLDLVISQFLVEKHPDNSEGFLSKTLAALINEKRLAAIARRLGLGESLRLGKGEQLTGGRDKDSILADAFEALIAAIYLDGGLKPISKIIQKQFAELLENGVDFTDYKTELQEVAQQKFRSVPVYKLINQTGKDHEKEFETTVYVQGQILGKGRGKNKKESQQQAAKEALESLRLQNRATPDTASDSPAK